VLDVMLTARDGTDDRIDGLERRRRLRDQAVDFRELLARLRALTRRRALPLSPERLDVGPLTIDMRTRELFIAGMPVPLTAREFACSSIWRSATARS
jgi:DNA-binding response OmpR family regulator